MQNVLLLRAFLAVLLGVLAVPLWAMSGWQPLLYAGTAMLLALAIAGLLWHARRESMACVPETLLLGACVLLGAAINTAPVRMQVYPERSEVAVTAQIVDPVEWQASFSMTQQPVRLYAAFMADVIRVAWAGTAVTDSDERVRMVLESDAPLTLARGDIVCLSGMWQRIPAATNPGQFDAATYFNRFGVRYRVAARAGELRWWTPPSLPLLLRVQRRLDAVRVACAHALQPEAGFGVEAALLRRMMLGTREAVPEEVTLALERTSTFHIIAISGLHLGIVGGLWYCLAWLAGVPGRWRGLAVLPLLWVYALMVGLVASVLRAMLMFSVFAAAPLVRRMHNATHTLLVAAFMYVLIAPADIAALGTQLTFLSVFALIAGMPLLDHLMLQLRWVRGPAVYDLEHRHARIPHVVLRYFVRIACGTIAIWALTWPIIVTKSNLVTPCSWLANLIVVPLLTIVLALGFITLVVSLLSASLAALVQVVNLGLLHGMLRYMDLISSTALSHFVIKSLTPAAVLCYYLALGLTWWWLRYISGTTPSTPRTRRAVAWSTSAAWLVFWLMIARDARAPQALRIVMLDVGLGDATVVHGRGGETLVIDGGVRHALWSAGARIVVPYLHCTGVNTVDAIICSHFDRDHCGGLYDVLEMTRVREVLAPPLGAPSPQADELRALAAVRGTAWRTVAAGDTCVWRTLTACALHPPQAITGLPVRVLLRSDNTWSLVLRISDGARTFLATGDATLLSEALQLHAGAAVRSDLLKLAHHGSASSSSPRYLAAVQPALATLSVGRNALGLPAAAVLERLRACSIPLLRTDQSGAILVELRPSTISMYTFDGPCTR